MLRTTLAAVALATTMFFAGYRAAEAQSAKRVYELRTYTAHPGKLDALLARFRNHTTKLLEKHGMKNVGYWVPQEEPLQNNTLIYIVSHSSREAAKKSWESFRNDPVWISAREESEKNGKLVEKVEAIYMDPTDFSALQ